MDSIDRLMDSIEWRELPLPDFDEDRADIPHATHEGTISLGDFQLRCYKLSDGQRIVDGKDFDKLFGGATLGEPA